MSEMMHALRLLRSEFPSAILRIDYPIHKGAPNPSHGKYHVVGRVPAACHGVKYTTEEECIAALIANGATRIQRTDCSFVKMSAPGASL